MDRFWSKVAKAADNQCWEWNAAKDPSGYGAFKFNGKKTNAHRVAYELEHGPITKDMEICHTCDNRSCVNPNHLFLGTRSDNMLDAYRKGRLPQAFNKGGIDRRPDDRAFHAKLTDDQVVEIRNIVRSGAKITYTELGERYGVHRTTIGRIIPGDRWKSLKRDNATPSKRAT